MNETAQANIPQEMANKLVTPSTYASDEIYEIYRWLRANNPLGVAEVPGFDPFWVVTKHEDVLAISRDNKKFPYGNRPSTLMDKASASGSMQTSESPIALSLIQMDEPMHMKYRILTQSWFMPGNLKKREQEIREIAKKSAARFKAMGGKGDFVEEVALNYPLEVVMNILGVPEKDFPMMLKITQEIFGPLDPDVKEAMKQMSQEDISKIQQAVVGELIQYFDTITKDRRANPKDDLATVIVHAEVDGKPISDAAINGYYLIIATAGHDTTSSSTSMGMWALATQPGLLKRLQADPSLLPAFIDESIRWATPVKSFMRSSAEDVEIRGRKIKKGDWLMLCYAAANRDEEAIPNPDKFDIDRKPNKHVAFGFGAHLCLGQALAKMEMKILWEEIIPKLRSVKLAGEPRMIESFFANGLKKLPIEFEFED
ncbi:cytochrome P450 [Halioxenophilus sp. WMMB6]|uniref:cytochrome P450 n=1 Tax=Halioxenophilus sp. WMMB6 TaxID=3073815 RepID=UPI00295EF7CB|nr:cytochrome P450 [Halioxenophilus sp. WMMB6]